MENSTNEGTRRPQVGWNWSFIMSKKFPLDLVRLDKLGSISLYIRVMQQIRRIVSGDRACFALRDTSRLIIADTQTAFVLFLVLIFGVVV